ncbi:DDT domain-containing protein DDR4 isoform X2 [Punica granatum]|uniref:DDT domain-containing protein DDR4 isoform X2 n=1 Tax=Punica granatum TaxID=22663 RepID=A0A6P8DI36_PUNGR|nr:DDT domain-containing protein DDR4 isoform X2 [Punica granatum]
MPDRHRRTAAEEDEAASGRDKKKAKVDEGGGHEAVVVLDGSDVAMEKELRRLREQWELASVLNFLCVFEPIMEKAPKISAEEIETAIIRPNDLLVQLHVKLLKGIPPVSKTLNCCDAWLTILRKKLNPWWPWVAEGEIPLQAANGEEMSKYKELDPIERLLILKALCELRLEQDDAVSHVNDVLQDGNQISFFRKAQVADDGNGTSYWYEGNAVIGHRLYQAIVKSDLSKNSKSKMESNYTVGSVQPAMSFQWETVATNLEEFRQVADELASSKERAKVAISGIIESDMIPVLERLKKKKENALKRIERQKMHLSSRITSYASVSSRSCRSHRLITYTYDDYDRAIDEAIRVTQKRKKKRGEEHAKQSKQGELRVEVSISDGGSDEDTDSNNKYHSSRSKTSIEERKEPEDDEDDGEDGEYDGAKEEVSEMSLDLFESDKENDRLGYRLKAPGVKWSKRLAGVTNQKAKETMKPNTRNLLRQRPVQNSAFDSIVVPDSDDAEN